MSTETQLAIVPPKRNRLGVDMRSKAKLVLGVGRNDAAGSVFEYEISGGRKKVKWACPAYRAWKNKDIISLGNKVYSPDTCIFVSPEINKFLTDSNSSRGEWPAGVYLEGRRGGFKAQCNNPFTGVREHLGYFTCPISAHQAWKARKHLHACTYADQQTDPRIAQALCSRYI